MFLLFRRSISLLEICCLTALIVFAGCGQRNLPPSAPAPAPQPAPQPPALGALELAPVNAPALSGAPERYAQLPPYEDVQVLDSALAAIFPDKRPDAPEAVAMAILRYVPAMTRLENAPYQRGSEVLANGNGNCLCMALAFVALCQRTGLPARVNAFHNIGVMQAHNAAEVYYGNAWHYYDPTYGVFFYTEENYDGTGRILALREAIAHTARDANPLMVLAPEMLWKGAPAENTPVIPLARDFKYGQYPFTLGELYDGLFARAFPVVESPVQTAVYPLDLGLRTVNSMRIGVVNGDIMDVLDKAQDGVYPRFRGVPVIGPTPVGGAALLLTFWTPGPGKYRLSLHLAPRSQPGALALTEVRDLHAQVPALIGNQWQTELYIESEMGQLLLSSPGMPVYLDAITAERLQ